LEDFSMKFAALLSFSLASACIALISPASLAAGGDPTARMADVLEVTGQLSKADTPTQAIPQGVTMAEAMPIQLAQTDDIDH
jgi:predicted polyphosphate/ATP-dependent NAD kinase